MLSTVIYAFFQSDTMGKFVVILLLALSAWVWCIMIEKVWTLCEYSAQCKKFQSAFKEAGFSPLALSGSLAHLQGPLKEICIAGLEELKSILQRDGTFREAAFRHGLLARPLRTEEIERIRSTITRTMMDRIVKMENNVGIVGTVVALSPQLGLFGTVWGVMLTFIGIAQAGRPDLMAIAPGISGALLTTVAGLLVAIPSLTLYNGIQRLLQNNSVAMETFCEDFITSLCLEETSLPQEQPADSIHDNRAPQGGF